jgi:hypothetical protein
VPVVTVREEATDAEPEKISVMPEPVLATADTEKRAANKLEQARELLFEGKRDEGMEYLRDIVTKWPNTKAGGTAKDLLESLKRRKDP